MKQNPREDYHELFGRIEHFCAYQERCADEVERRLKTWKASGPVIAKIIQQLRDDGFLNEERFARMFVRGKFHINRWGRVKIAHELKIRNIPEDIILVAMEEIGQEDYMNTLHDLIVSKHSGIPSGNILKIREKILNFVIGKGFEAALAIKILNELKLKHDHT